MFESTLSWLIPLPDAFPYEPPAAPQAPDLPPRTPSPRAASRLQDPVSSDCESWHTPADIPIPDADDAFHEAEPPQTAADAGLVVGTYLLL
jgi:hypothetical protein